LKTTSGGAARDLGFSQGGEGPSRTGHEHPRSGAGKGVMSLVCAGEPKVSLRGSRIDLEKQQAQISKPDSADKPCLVKNEHLKTPLKREWHSVKIAYRTF